MQFAVLSHPSRLQDEIKLIKWMFDQGLMEFHLRKPNWSKLDIERFIHKIPVKYRERVFTHTHPRLTGKYELGGTHFSGLHKPTIDDMRALDRKGMTVTKVEELPTVDYRIDYLLFGPVFNSIQQHTYHCRIDDQEMLGVLETHGAGRTILALGGIDAHNIERARELGFDGVVAFAALWEVHLASGIDQTKEKFLELQAICRELAHDTAAPVSDAMER